MPTEVQAGAVDPLGGIAAVGEPEGLTKVSQARIEQSHVLMTCYLPCLPWGCLL
jgi:hypothetical protein